MGGDSTTTETTPNDAVSLNQIRQMCLTIHLHINCICGLIPNLEQRSVPALHPDLDPLPGLDSLPVHGGPGGFGPGRLRGGAVPGGHGDTPHGRGTRR